jgi:hypothetical protein
METDKQIKTTNHISQPTQIPFKNQQRKSGMAKHIQKQIAKFEL